jgi:GTP-binding protein
MIQPEHPVEKRRVVAIVGRPNVGKSAIFNRLVGRRVAIVHEESGVTRDRLMREVVWGDERFDLIDTGGVCNMDGAVSADSIEAAVRKQVDIALADAAVALFVVDIQAGVMPMDLEVARLLRESAAHVLVLANKADATAKDERRVEFEQFGFPVFAVSALHDLGFPPLMHRVLKALPESENVTVANPLKVAVVGRPNVGKSSYINRLLRSDRVIVSAVPGTTRDSIDIPFAVGTGDQARHYLLIDTAGMRAENKVSSAVESYSHISAEKSVGRADVVVLMLDAVQGPTSQDKRIGAFIRERQKGCVVVVNKWDLADAVSQREYGPALLRVIPFMAHCPIVFASATTGYNMRRSVEVIDHVAAQVRLRLPTGVLNRTLLDACERVQPPSIQGKRLKIYYSTQVGTEPIRVRLFVNDPGRVKDAYTNYLVHVVREKFGLEGAPVLLEFTARPRQDLGEQVRNRALSSDEEKARRPVRGRREEHGSFSSSRRRPHRAQRRFS